MSFNGPGSARDGPSSYGFGAAGAPKTGTDEPVEDGPSMRSVAMMSPGPMRSGPLEGGLNFSKPPPLKSFGAPPPMGISRPSSAGLRMSSRASSTSSEVFGMKKEWTGEVSSAVWDVKGEYLEMVPVDFPLERTNRQIMEDASKVATRISDVLRTMSVEAEYDNKKAKAKCKTSELVKFRIRLYAGGENGQPVVVEVQRRSGSSSCFMRSCRAILDAAEGKECDAKSQKKVPSFVKKPIGAMKCLQSVLPKKEEVVATSVAALDGVMELLRSSQRDTNLLGLENLNFLVDPVKSVPSGALAVSKCVVLGDEKYDIREEMRVLMERDVFTPEFDDEEGPAEQPDHARYLALSIFALSLGMCSKDGCLAKGIESQKWFEEYLIPSLVDEVGRAEESTNTAYQAACCIQSLVVCSATARRLVIENKGIPALEQAASFGKVRHELLGSEAASCLELLQ